MRLFGYTEEELELIVRPMARDGAEPVGSMGVDTPLAVLSERPQLLPGYFKQHFAQVTNPAIDPQRETLVMSLRTSVGAHGNLLDEWPEHAGGSSMTQPVLSLAEHARLRHSAGPLPRRHASSLPVRPSGRAPGSSARSTQLCQAASRAVSDGTTILVLSDRGADATRCRSRSCSRPPPCTATSCARARARCAGSSSSRASRAR